MPLVQENRVILCRSGVHPLLKTDIPSPKYQVTQTQEAHRNTAWLEKRFVSMLVKLVQFNQPFILIMILNPLNLITGGCIRAYSFCLSREVSSSWPCAYLHCVSLQTPISSCLGHSSNCAEAACRKHILNISFQQFPTPDELC